eukprot:CAMPEP_0170634754 /NCGR_PEP_ID=MMETSP0224-20130122/36803_1 /TAXON_ID=285029 /ORGANISM="Togula jolla, Strain CCCM 725" /LENGTH=131 /DNA_ID=CAMNT_0010964101 /DNA_START=38 /DNA_END=433 /DNA_ORIENTATION=-
MPGQWEMEGLEACGVSEPTSMRKYDIDGGRQSPFSDEGDSDYDSCHGPELVTGVLTGCGPWPSTQMESGGYTHGKDLAPSSKKESEVADILMRCFDDNKLFLGTKRGSRHGSSLSPPRKRFVAPVPFKFSR